MGMHTYIQAIRPPDAKWQSMKAVYDSCMDAGVPLPVEVERFFGGDKPCDKGVIVRLDRDKHYTEGSDDGRDWMDLDLTKLPNDVKIVRFVASF